MRYENENIWLTQRMMAELYGVDVRTVNDHLKKVYSDGELRKEATIRKYRIVQTESSRQVSREVKNPKQTQKRTQLFAFASASVIAYNKPSILRLQTRFHGFFFCSRFGKI